MVSQVVLDAVTVLHLSPTGHLATLRYLTTGQRVELLDGATGTMLNSWPVPAGESVMAARVAPDGKRVAVASTRDQDRGTGESYIRVWESATGRVRQEIRAGETPSHPRFYLRFAPDGRRLYALLTPGQWRHGRTPDSALRGWDLRTGTPLFAFAMKSVCEDGSMAVPGNLAVSPDGKLAAVGGQQRPTQLYDLPGGTLRCRLPIITNSAPVFDPSGKVLIVGGFALTQWDATTGKRLARSPPHGLHGWLAFSADGRRLMVCPSEYSDRVEWNPRTGQEMSRVSWTDTAHDAWIGHCGSINLDDRARAVRSTDGALAAQLIMHWENPQHPDNGKITLRDGRTGRQLRTLPRIGNWAYGLAFSADGRFLVNDGLTIVKVYGNGQNSSSNRHAA